MIKIKRIYEIPVKEDGYRILVDRLWPRGITKEKGKLDLWMKEIAPSDELRKWFNHDPLKWNEFRKKYYAELKLKDSFIREIKKLDNEIKVITLLYSAKDESYNNAAALKEYLEIK